uniref:Adhesion G protein-coupled receptor F5-like n=1 Tax=Neogobius melanostomus TaxID=47308 RepID=A0A8C6S378_9GOBI
ELNTTDPDVINLLRTVLGNASYPISVNNSIRINSVALSTVCSPNNSNYQCTCEEQYRWSCDLCLFHGSCDSITNDTCGCINGRPDGQYCQPFDTPAFLHRYIVSIELNTTDPDVINLLRTVLGNASYPISVNNTEMTVFGHLSPVCSPNNSNYQCTCEEQYRWSCDLCLFHGSCDSITNDTCGCINGRPDGQYCQPFDTPAFLHRYIVSIELNTTDPDVINLLRTVLGNASYPISVNNSIRINSVDLSTVCSPNNSNYQCTCEEQYRWSCDLCLFHGSCDSITNDTCGCINGRPDGQYCQPFDSTPAFLHGYIVSIELNTTDPDVINLLRTVLGNTSYPISVNNSIRINSVDLSTVCSPNNSNYQCTCEEQYRWSCDLCLFHGSCDSITNDTCGCINGRPDGQYCQPFDSNFTACPSTTPAPTTLNILQVTDWLILVTSPTTNVTITTNGTTAAVTTANIPTTSDATTAVLTDTTNATTALSTPPDTPTTPPDTTSPDTSTIPTAPTTPPDTPTTTIETSPATPTTPTAPTTPPDTPTTTIETTPAIPTTPTAPRTPPDTPTTTIETSNATPTTPTATTTPPDTPTTTIETSTATPTTPTATTPSPVTPTTTLTSSPEMTHTTERITPAPTTVATTRPPVNGTEFNTSLTLNISLTIYLSICLFMPPSTPTHTPLPKAKDSITIPSLTYTGKSMTLQCGDPPPDINLGNVSGAEWKFKGWPVIGSRYSMPTNKSLTINQVIMADIGEYQFTLRGTVLNYIQKGSVTEENIKQAPNIRLSSTINAQCDGTSITLTCCVQSVYQVTWFLDGSALPTDSSNATGDYCIKTETVKNCESDITKMYTCRVDTLPEYNKTTTLILFREPVTCNDATYGTGRVGDTSVVGCEKGQLGNKTAVCDSNGKWKLIKDVCIVEEINELLIESGDLNEAKVPAFVDKLRETVDTQKEAIAQSSNSISAIVDMIDTVSNVSVTVDKPVMQNVLEVVDDLSAEGAASSWKVLNKNKNSNASSQLLNALEIMSKVLEGEISITTPRIMLNRTTFNNSFSTDLNSSITVEILDTHLSNVFITTIAFSSLYNILPPRNASFRSFTTNSTDNSTDPVFNNVINAGVVLIKVNQEINNVTLAYEKRNSSLSLHPQCVFWNFDLLDGLGAWDTEGCTFVSDINDKVTCNCSHLTSFSILMSTQIPKRIQEALDIITYIGVGISLGSLVICLVIEAYIWKKVTRNSTALMRHVSIVNTALSLLIADICFIIAASVAKNPLSNRGESPGENPGENYEVPVGPCSTATFFMHFFYLALFFWMLVSGMLLFYRTVMVFSHMSKSSMLAIGFCVGYGAPLIIAVITVAVTASRDGYIRKYETCWLNWDETMALLALVIPALTIVFINMIILFVVLYKMLRRGGIGETSDEKQTLKVIVRCVLILTPLFGLTWSLGVGTMVAPTNEGIHIAFAFFNSLQGLFILVFGTLYDSKVSLRQTNLFFVKSYSVMYISKKIK